MARTFTERRIATPSTLKFHDINEEHSAVARQINGCIDQHNVPLAAVSEAKLIAGVPLVSLGARSTYLAANSYHRTVLPALGLDSPRAEITPGTDQIGGGWNSLADVFGGDDGVVLEFAGRDGMIHGHALIDFERRTSYAVLTEDDLVTVTDPDTGDGNRLQFGVFLNDILVADSGPIPCRRFTLDLPFSYPSPSGPVRVEMKFQAVTIFQVAAGYVNGDGTTWAYVAPAIRYPKIRFHAAAIYARGQYR